MNGFAVWAQSPAGTLALTECGLVVGMILGYLTGHKIGWRAGDRARYRDERAENRAVAWFRGLRAEDVTFTWPGGSTTTVDRRGRVIGQTPPEVAHEWEPAHVGAALALANDDPTVSAWTADMAASMDRWLAEHVYGVPYSADELWSGQ